MEYYSVIIHRAGVKHQAADALLHLNTNDTNDLLINGNIQYPDNGRHYARIQEAKQTHQQHSKKDSYRVKNTVTYNSSQVHECTRQRPLLWL